MRQNTRSIILSTAYFPPIQYFQCCVKHKRIHIEHNEYYKRHSTRNRCTILGANGPLLLTVPIHSSSKELIKNIRIAHESWRKNHINSLKSAYGSSPFFIYYFEDIKKIINKKHNFLIDLNMDILYYFSNELQLNNCIEYTEKYIRNYPEDIEDQRHVTQKISKQKKYHQVFGENFIKNLSIIDLIFNIGPKAKEYICV
ncbi:MAG: hypothetical protein CMD23_04995 [Flavobacteriales bacterium]|nr:hypothetical protein [Flavobacteriales bacterium]